MTPRESWEISGPFGNVLVYPACTVTVGAMTLFSSDHALQGKSSPTREVLVLTKKIHKTQQTLFSATFSQFLTRLIAAEALKIMLAFINAVINMAFSAALILYLKTKLSHHLVYLFLFSMLTSHFCYQKARQ